MAAKQSPDLYVKWSGRTYGVYMSDWTYCHGCKSCCWAIRKATCCGVGYQNRSNIVHAIIVNRRLSYLETILQSGWDVNETLRIPIHPEERRIYTRYRLTATPVNAEWTALHLAVNTSWTAGVKLLLEAGAKCKVPGALENPLTTALRSFDSKRDLIELLLKHGADPNVHGPSGKIPLMEPISKFRLTDDCSKILGLLLKHGADPNVVEEGDETSSTPLHKAVGRGWTDGVRILLDASAKCITSAKLENPLTLALQKDDCPSDLIEMLLKHGADPNNHNLSHNIPLMRTISMFRFNNSSRKILELLLKYGADPNVVRKVEGIKASTTPLHEAVENGWTEAVHRLLDAGAMYKLEDLLTLALQNGACPPDLIDLLLQQGADPNHHDGRFNNIPLLQAITNRGSDENVTNIVQLLLEHGARANAAAKYVSDEDDAHRTALECAVRHQCPPDVFALLLKYGADANYHTTVELTSLLHVLATYRSHLHQSQIVKLLLEHGVSPNVARRVNIGRAGAPKWVNSTPLDAAVWEAWTDDVTLPDGGGTFAMSGPLENPLTLALQNVDCTCNLIWHLLKHGANPNYHLSQKDIPLICAIKNCRMHTDPLQTVRLLLEHGAKPDMTSRVNIGTANKPTWVHTTALQEAARQGWTQGMKVLLEAGATWKTSSALQNPLTLAIVNDDCPPELIELFLKHGADPNDHGTDEHIPLLYVITKYKVNALKIVKMLLEHGANPNVAHRLMIEIDRETRWVDRSALQEAANIAWTEGVKMLLDAGAEFKTAGAVENPLTLALQNRDCQPELIELLLTHGADPNQQQSYNQNIPLMLAIKKCRHNVRFLETVQLLLEYGADIHVRGERGDRPLSAALDVGCEVFAALFKTLLHFGVDVNLSEGRLPLLHQLVQTLNTYSVHHLFAQEQLDQFFQHGGNINVEDGEQIMVLSCAIGGQSNIIRWLIRHGMDISQMNVSWLLHYFLGYRYNSVFYRETPLIMLHAGMRVSHEVHRELQNMIRVLPINSFAHYDWSKLAEDEERQGKQDSIKKSTFPEYCRQQMVDLQEFSDWSLHIYPEPACSRKQTRQDSINQLHRVLEFLSQLQSLQWYCRRCVRENLVSLQPSVVKTLPIPSRMKRYIMCHEI